MMLPDLFRLLLSGRFGPAVGHTIPPAERDPQEREWNLAPWGARAPENRTMTRRKLRRLRTSCSSPPFTAPPGATPPNDMILMHRSRSYVRSPTVATIRRGER